LANSAAAITPPTKSLPARYRADNESLTDAKPRSDGTFSVKGKTSGITATLDPDQQNNLRSALDAAAAATKAATKKPDSPAARPAGSSSDYFVKGHGISAMLDPDQEARVRATIDADRKHAAAKPNPPQKPPDPVRKEAADNGQKQLTEAQTQTAVLNAIAANTAAQTTLTQVAF
jgi:hypothetical protein